MIAEGDEGEATDVDGRGGYLVRSRLGRRVGIRGVLGSEGAKGSIGREGEEDGCVRSVVDVCSARAPTFKIGEHVGDCANMSRMHGCKRDW